MYRNGMAGLGGKTESRDKIPGPDYKNRNGRGYETKHAKTQLPMQTIAAPLADLPTCLSILKQPNMKKSEDKRHIMEDCPIKHCFKPQYLIPVQKKGLSLP